jgi:uncharacterized membrane protein YtjA (UPF0391 family)
VIVSDVAAGNPIQQGSNCPANTIPAIYGGTAGSPRKEQRAGTLAAARISGLPQPAGRRGSGARRGYPEKVGQQLIPINGEDQLLPLWPEPVPLPEVGSAISVVPPMRRWNAEGDDDDTIKMGAGLLSGVDRRRYLGFTGISAATADIARFLFYVFVVIFLVLLILGLTIFRV